MLKVDVDDWVGRLRAVRWLPLETLDQVKEALCGVLRQDEGRLASRIRATQPHVTPSQNRGLWQAFIPLDGDKTSGELLAFEVAQGPVVSPDHVHNSSPDADYGEMYWTLEGKIEDVTDQGEPFTHDPGQEPVTHGPNTRHQPRIPVWWIGLFYQPAGSRLAE